MAKQNNQTPKRAVFSPFGGIDTRSPHKDEPSAADIVNFRITEDGSLSKREGSHVAIDMSAPIRASWTGKLFHDQDIVILTGSEVILYRTDTKRSVTLGNVLTSSSAAQFFFYRDRLYLIDTEALYEIQANAVVPIEPYIPLIGKDWSTTTIGEIHEERNLLTRRAKIHYVVDEMPSVFFRTLYSVESVDALYRNDELVDPSKYSYEEPIRSIILQEMKPGDRIRVHLTYARFSELSMENQSLPSSCSRVDIFGDTTNSRLFFWNGHQSNLFYPSAYVSEEMLEESKSTSPNSVPLYVPEGSACVLGDGRYSITGFIRQYDRILIFNECETWMANTDSLSEKKFLAKPIHPYIGCAKVDGCTAWENTPFVIGTNDIYRFTADTDEYNEGNAHSICEPIRSLLPTDFFIKAKVFACRSRGELWFYTPESNPIVWIYRPSGNEWYRFSGLAVSGLFEENKSVFFYNDQALCIFDSADREDTDADGVAHEIVAEYHSNLLEYGTHAPKRFCELILRADCDGGSISVSLHGDGIGALTCSFSDESEHSIFCRRLSSGRFRYATLSLYAGGAAKQTVHSLTSDVR